MGHKKKSDAEETIAKVAAAMSGVEWDAQVANKVADILYAAGYEIPEPDAALMPPACCPFCGKRERLYVHETATISYEYDAQRHLGNTDTEATEHTREDYTAHCGACNRGGTLEAFGMKLVDWTNDLELELEEDGDADE
jgi:hypothetical protein